MSLLILSGLLTSVIGNLAEPRSMPDEAHHYAYTKYVADHFGQFPIDYAAIFTDSKERPNHLLHPPLYYYLMATAYLVLTPDRNLTEIGRAQDTYGRVSSSSAIPMLRTISRLLAFLGLIGLYLLVRFLVERGLLRPGYALIFVALTAFIPGFLYIGAGLNNDVLALAIWPFATRYALEYFVDGDSGSFWRTLTCLAAMVLTKATLWVLVLVLGCMVALRFFSECRDTRILWRYALAKVNPIRHGILPVWALLALCLGALAMTHLASNWLRYDSIQPNFLTVFDLSLEDSSFYKPYRWKHTKPMNWHQTMESCFDGVLVTTNGFGGHKENILRPNGLWWAWLLLASAFLIAVAWLSFFRTTRFARSFKQAVCFFVGAFCLQWFVVICLNYQIEQEYRLQAAQGRYFIGYLPLFLLSLSAIAGSVPKPPATLWQWVEKLSTCLGIAGLFWVLCDPLFFTRETQEHFRRGGVPQLIAERMKEEGFAKLNLNLSWSLKNPFPALEANLPDQNKSSRRQALTLDKTNAALGCLIPLSGMGQDAIEIRVWARGESAWGSPPRLVVGLADPGNPPKPLRFFDPNVMEKTIPDHNAVQTFILPGSLPAKEKGLVWLTLAAAPKASNVWGRQPSRKCQVTIFEVYYRFIASEKTAQDNPLKRYSGHQGDWNAGPRFD